MPPRRRKRRAKPRRKKKKRVDPMKARMGMTGWKGSKPYHGWSKTLTTVTMGEGHNPGGTTGALFSFPVNNWNDPLGTMNSLVAGTGSLTSDRHPMHHDNAIADKYEVAQVLSWKAEIDVNWIKADLPTGDFIVAYTFVQDENSAVTLGTGATGRLEVLAIQTNPRWTVKHFRAVQSFDEVRKRRNSIIISVPNVYRYCKTISSGQVFTAFSSEVVSHEIKDVSHASSAPAVKLFCRIVIMAKSGLDMLVDSVHVTVAITQKVKIMRNKRGDEDMLEGVPDTHV